MLHCENLEKRYMTVTAIKDMTLDIEKGKIYALLGPNGSGKSTFMKIVAGLTRPTKGLVTMDGKPLSVESKKKIAYMPTEAYFYNYMNCEDVGKYYADFFEDFSIERFHRLMEELELTHKDKVNKMSSGMTAKLKLAVTLARDAHLIMLDEPLNGIDIIARDTIINTVIKNARDDNSSIISSHLVDELEKIIDYAVFIKNGSVALCGEAEKLRDTHGRSIVELYKEIYTAGGMAAC